MTTLINTARARPLLLANIPHGAIPPGPIVVAVANLASPTELASYAGSAGTSLLACHGAEFTLYAWTSSATPDSPRVVAGSSGYWVAIGGGVGVFKDAEGDPAAIGTAADGTSAYAARRDHVHAGDHVNLANKGTNTHSQIDTFISSKAAANGLASLGATSLVPTAQLGTGTANDTVFLRGDGTWAAAGAGASFSDAEGDPANIGTTADGTSTYAARRDHVHAAPDATTSTKGIASFSSTYFSVSSGAVSIKAQGVPYAQIQNVSATDKILGRVTSGAGTIEEISCTSAGRAILDDATAGDQRTTLGLGGAAVLNVGTSAGTVAAGNDSRFVTNGDSHDHSGGDGAQVSHLNLSNIGTNSHSTIDTFISSKGAANGLASLGATTLVPTAQLGTGTANNTVFLRGDQTWQAVTASPAGSDTQVQFNDGGAAGADAGMTYNKATDNCKLIATSAGAVTVPLTLHNVSANTGTGVQINLVAYTDVAVPTGKIIHKYDATTSYTNILGVYPSFNTITLTDTKVGIKVADPTHDLSFEGTAAKYLGIERNTTSNTAGSIFQIQGGGATVGATDKSGGSVYIVPGIPTGNAESGVRLYGGGGGSTGTDDANLYGVIETLSSKIGFWGSTPITRQTLAAYISDPESTKYTGTNVAGLRAETNALRVAYENLRAMCEDLRTKITNTTLIALP